MKLITTAGLSKWCGLALLAPLLGTAQIRVSPEDATGAPAASQTITNAFFSPGTGTNGQLFTLTNAATGAGTWRNAPYNGLIEDNFVGGLTTSGNIGKLGWSIQGTYALASGNSILPGAGSITSGAGVTNVASLYLGGLTTTPFGIMTNIAWVKRFVWRPIILADLTNSVIRVGIFSGALDPTEPANGMFIVASNTTAKGTFFAVNANAGVNTIATSGVQIGLLTGFSYYTNDVICLGNGLISHALNGVVFATLAGTPTSFAGPCRPDFIIVNTLGEAGGKNLNIDYFGAQLPTDYRR